MTMTTKIWACCAGALLGGTLAAAPALAETKPLGEKIGERISRGIVEESLETLDKKENQERLGRIMNSPQMRKGMHDLTASIVMGVFDGVKQAQSKGLLTTPDIAKSVGDGMNEHITPAVGKLTYRLVDSAISASLSDKSIARVEKLGEGATHAAIRGLAHGLEQDLGPALAVTIDRDLGPAVAKMIERDIMPAVGRGLNSADMQAAITRTTNSVATGLVYGTDNALEETNIAQTEDGESKLKVFGGRLAIGYAVALFVAFAFATMLVVLTVMLVRGNRRQRKQQSESRRREEALLHLIDSIEADHPELKTDMRRVLREQLHTEP
jgi:large-conductance mechanosensitive channel